MAAGPELQYPGSSFGIGIDLGNGSTGLAAGNASFSAIVDMGNPARNEWQPPYYCSRIFIQVYVKTGTVAPTSGTLDFKFARVTVPDDSSLPTVVDDGLPDTKTFNIAPSTYNSFANCKTDADWSLTAPSATSTVFVKNFIVTDLPRRWQLVVVNNLDQAMAVDASPTQQVLGTAFFDYHAL